MALQLPWFLLASIVVISQLLVPVVAAGANSSIAPSPMANPGQGCSRWCGNVGIPYPFGLSDECSLKGQFTITCNNSFSPPRPFVGDYEIINISLVTGEMRILSPVAHICYNSSNTTTQDGRSLDFMGLPLGLIVSTRNDFVAIGCNTVAAIVGREDGSFLTGCISTCASLHQAANDGDYCTGLGCCQTPIASNVRTVEFVLTGGAINDINPGWWRYSPCSFAFIADKEWYHFRRRDLARLGNKIFTDRVGENSHLVMDWAIRTDDTCQLLPETSRTLPTASACVSNNSHCTNATQGPGYLCICSSGYMGNPYIHNGCTNINECALRKSNPAIYEKLYHCGSHTQCHDTEGDYECKCNRLYKGDGKSENGCQSIFHGYATAIVVTFISSAILLVLLFLLYKEYMQRIRRGFFDKNGGKILKGMDINIFTEEELKKITNDYRDLIGKGSFGRVYKGETDDQQEVAVKRPIVDDEKPRPGGEFIDEITFQFQIRHTNLVRLIGCCLETKHPRLVFEFIPNGSLYDMLHGTENPHVLSLQQRIDIAIGTAEALTYMHLQAGHNNRIHGDIKSGNILLDNDMKPKVSDFGSSKLVSIASRIAKWSVSGDLNYIDPVYMNTGYFTEKSDVYSFGVVLLELITRKKAKYDENNSLTMNFVKSYKKEGNGRRMYDKDIFSDHDHQSQTQMECLDRISTLAVQCLKEDIDERPTMAEVMEELKQVKLQACIG